MSSKINLLFKSKEDYFLILIAFSIPLYFILDANNQFWGLIPISGSLQIIGYSIAGALFFFFLISLFLSPPKATVLLGVYLVWYLFFKTIQVKLGAIQVFSFIRNLGYYFGISILLLALITTAVCLLKEPNARKVSKYLNVLFLILFFIEASKTCFLLMNRAPDHVVNKIKFKPIVPKSRPDIYLIVMDEYAGAKSLQYNFRYNNQAFVNRLRADSFFVADGSNSNYNSTLFSLASMLNLNYSNSFIEKDLKDISAFGNAAKEIQDNVLVPFLISNGYEIKNYSGFRMQEVASETFYFMAIENRLALEKTFGNVLRNEIFTRLPSNSLQRILGTHVARVDQYNQSVFAQCKKYLSEENNNPQFVYAHFFMPHEPFLYRKDGTPRKYVDAFFDKRRGTYKKSYSEYIEYTNSRIVDLINCILRQKDDKVVLLVSDHGERFTEGTARGTAYNNFFSVYNSQKNYSGFSDTFPLINTFRVILNTYFNQQLPMLENKQLNVYTGKNDMF